MSNNTTQANTGHGISVDGPSRVFGNTSIENVRFGLRIQSTVAFGQNVIALNGDCTVDGGGVQMGQNFCDANLTCP
jgi:hypothetical protein